MTTFTLSRNLEDETQFIGHLTVYENNVPVKAYKIEAKTQEEFERIAKLTKELYVELHSDESSKALVH